MRDTPLETIALYVGLAVAYAIAGYCKSVLRDPETHFSPRKFGKTVLVGLVAGGYLVMQGDEAGFGELEAAMAIAIPVVDQIVSGLAEYHSRDESRRAA